MLRKILPVLVMLLSFGVLAASQDGNLLRQQLPTQDEIQSLLGDSWFVDGLSELDPLPDGALVSAVATYDDGNTSTLIIALIDFEGVDSAGGYISAFSEAPIVAVARDLKQEAEENPELLSELVMTETDQVILLELVNQAEQLLIRRGPLASFLRASPDSGIDNTRLLEIAEFQLQKLIDFCDGVEGEASSYC